MQSQWRRCFIVMSMHIYIYIYVCIYMVSPPKKVHLFSVSTGTCCVHTYIYIYIDIEEIQGTKSPKSRKIQQVMIEQNLHYFLIKTMHFEKLAKGTPLGRLPSPNNVHVHP